MVTVFARLMILQRELLGKPSITNVKPEDLDKLKHPKYRVSVDTPISLPACNVA